MDILDHAKKFNLLLILVFLILMVDAQHLASQGFTSVTPLAPIPFDAGSGTADKSQSKVFFHDGKHWAVLGNAETVLPSGESIPEGTNLYRLDGTSWTFVTNLVSSRGRADIKIIGDVAHIFVFRNSTSFLISMQYVASTQSFEPWSPRPSPVGFSFNNEVQTATIDVDGEDVMWMAYERNNEVITHWSNYPYSVWSEPIVLATVSEGDIATVIALPDKIGVFWSNQNTQRFGFRTHINGDPAGTWSPDEVPASQSALAIGAGMADDHMNLVVNSSGTLFCAVKHGYNNPAYPLISLLVRNPDGTWDNSYTVSNTGTTPIVLLNENLGKLKVIYSSQSLGGEILYKESSTTNISFGPEQVLIGGGSYQDPTSIKNTYHPEVVVLATNPSSGTAVGVLGSDAPIPVVPNAPELVSPVNSAVDVPINSTLTWNPVEDAATYQVQVSLNSSFATTVSDESGLAGTSFQVSGLEFSTRYFWRVRATNASGTGAWSETRSFTTEDAPVSVPVAPVLVAPANAATGVETETTLLWEAVSGAESYQVQVSLSSSFATTVSDESGLAGISFEVSGLEFSTRYFWRVRATNGSGIGAWSETRSFTTEDAPVVGPEIPVQLSPLPSAVKISKNPTLKWTGGKKGHLYQVQISVSPDFSRLVFDEETPSTSAKVHALEFNTVYYWRVRSFYLSQYSEWSPTWSFTTLVGSANAKPGGNSGKTPPGLNKPSLPDIVDLVKEKTGGLALGLLKGKGNSAAGAKARISSPETESGNTVESQIDEIDENYFMPQKQVRIKSHPNPVSDFLVIEFIGEKPEVTSVLIYDKVGRLYFRDDFNLNSRSLRIDRLDTVLIPGVYYIQVLGHDFIETFKILKE